MQDSSVKTLAVVTSLFFFTSNLSGSFLIIYFRELGLGVIGIAEVLFFTFLVIGLLPLILLKSSRKFEHLMSFGILSTMIFFAIVIYVRNPMILGLFYGLSMATFWPSFNLLQFRLSESNMRARTVGMFSSIIPSLAGITGPAVSGFIIESSDFATLFTIAIALYLIAFVLCARIQFKPEIHEFSIPRSRTFFIFFISFIILGFSEVYWVAYPFLVYSVSETVFNMGLVLAFSAILISAVTFLVNWFSDVKKVRVGFAILGTVLNCAWCLAIPYAKTTYELVALSLLSGLASAFAISWFAYYGDSFRSEHYASILVMMEVGFMIGRLVNLIPTMVFIPGADYNSYFALLGFTTLLMIPLYISARPRMKMH